MKLILIPLFILLLGSLFNLTDPSSFVANSTVSQTGGGVNGTTATHSTSGFNISNLTLSVVVILGIMLVIVIAASISVLGSGIAAGGARLIVIITTLVALWFMLSLTGAPPILAIPSPFGLVIYLILTMMYVEGAIQTVSGQGGGNA